jgi:hypothetical protein
MTMQPDDLERVIGQRLARQPLPTAPPTLLPRVMAAIHRVAQRPWYERAWPTWPLAWQLASAAALVALVAVIGLLLPAATATVDGASGAATAGLAADLADVMRRVQLIVATAQILWRSLLQPIVVYAFAVALAMCLACAAFGAALTRVALGRAY